MSKQIRHRSKGLPLDMSGGLASARQARGWSQAQLGARVGLPQAHISGIETGKVAPRFNTLLDIVRTLGFDLLLVPRALVPAVQAMVRDSARPDPEASGPEAEELPLYASENPEGGGDS